MKLSIIILNYNVCHFLELCLKSVERAILTINAEIIVIDNNSDDGSCEMVKQFFPEVILIKNSENFGFSKGNNIAVSKAKGEYLCILNPDTVVAENTFLKLLDFTENKEKLGIVGCKLINGSGNFLPESKRNIIYVNAAFKKMSGYSKNYYANHLNQNDIGVVDILVGAFMLLKRDLFNSVQGFDEDYFMYGEDIDFSYKIANAGYVNHYLGSLNTLHYKGESTQKDAVYYDRFYGAMRIFYKKHFKPNLLLNLAVAIGVSMGKMLQSTGRNKRQVVDFVPEKAYVFSENFSLYSRISEKLDIELKTASKSIFDDGAHRNSLFIFDVTYMPYSQIFSVMQRLKNRNNQFRICPPKSNFIIGSDKSDEKGSVIVF